MKLPLTKYQRFASVLIVTLIIPLILYAYIGIFTRYVADDYETAGALARYGFMGAQQYWYQTWSGRITYFALVSAVEMLGIQAVPYLTAACLTLWVVGLYWTLRQLAEPTHIPHPALTSFLGVSLILFVTLRSLNQIHQILFWQTGLLTYANYLIFFTFGLAWWISRLKINGNQPASPIELLVSLVYAFVIAGISEISIALQITAITLILILFVIFPATTFRKKGLGLAIAALMGSLISFAIMASAPGNLIRATYFSARPDLVSLVINSLKYTFTFLGNWVDKQPILVALAILIPVMAALAAPATTSSAVSPAIQDHKLTAGFVLSSAALFLLIWSGFFTSFAVMSGPPPDRALVIPQYVLVMFIVLWSYQIGHLISAALNRDLVTPRFWKLVGGVVLAICLLLGPVYASYRIAGTIPTSRAIALEWDQRDAVIREAIARGERHITVWYIRDLNRLGDYSSDPDFLVNRAAADYYGIETIIALDKE
jgi:hypothetical protein